MAQSQTRSGGSEVRFNHGLAVEDEQPDVQTTTRALRRAVSHADTDVQAAEFADLLSYFVARKQHTEGHKAIVARLDEEEIFLLHLAHQIAAESIPSWDGDIEQSFWDNKRSLPTSA